MEDILLGDNSIVLNILLKFKSKQHIFPQHLLHVFSGK